MNRIDFAVCLHFHQPVGNLTEIFERVYQRCYRPFLEYLPYYPDIKITLHISGSLMDYFKQEHPEILKLVKDMASRGQIEIIGGAYYEPILAMIPPRDIKGQITLMQKCIRDEFGSTSKGMWIPERIWRPDMAGYLYKAGIRYCILDDTHLMLAGVKREEIYTYFFTGRRQEKIAVFPSDKTLRYIIPFKEPKAAVDYLNKVSQKKKNALVVYADDAEKFGEWPGTYDWVYTKGWLKAFFDCLVRNRDRIRMVRLRDCLNDRRRHKSVCIPEVSYEEMLRWAQGPWSNFLKKYSEAGHMFRKMLYVSGKVDEFNRRHKENKKDIYWSNIELYKGQCNCGYWHGVFGGLYMYHLRSAIYNHLIAAENIIDRALHKNEEVRTKIKQFDLDGDGRDEFIAENDIISAYFDPEEGGAIKEIDFKPICANIVNTVSRRKEVYHKNVKKVEPSLTERLVYDKHPRYCLRNYFLDKALKREDFADSLFNDHGNFADGEYQAQIKDNGFSLKRRSVVSGAEIELSKDITMTGNTIEIGYSIKKFTEKKFNFSFGTEFNLTMPFLNSGRYRYFSDTDILGTLNTKGRLNNTISFGILDSAGELEVKFVFSKKPKEIWYFPVETVSQSQTAYRLNYQCSCILLLWKPVFGKNGIYDLKITWCIGQGCR